MDTFGSVTSDRHLTLDDAIPDNLPKRVRVIVLFEPEIGGNHADQLRPVSVHDPFAFLDDPREDIYTLADGKPLK